MKTVEFVTKKGDTLKIQNYELLLITKYGDTATASVHENGIVYTPCRWAVYTITEAWHEYLNQNEEAFQAQFDRQEEWYNSRNLI